MLNLDNFDLIRNDGKGIGDILSYYGENTGYMYTVFYESGYFTVYVEALDENGDAYCKERYGVSALSAAIATIEAIENGEEV